MMRTVHLTHDLDLMVSLGPLVASHHDPTMRLRRDRFVRASRTPDGPGTIRAERASSRSFMVEAWGPGAPWLLEHAPGLLGCDDDPARLQAARHPAVARAAHRRPGLRMIRTGCVADLLVPTILAQRVTAIEAGRSWTRIVRQWGEPAPGPHGLRLPPTAAQLAATPSWAFHRLGVERDRARKIVAATRQLDRLEDAARLPGADGFARLTAIPGLGPWTAALVLRTATGDPDVVEVGDYHVKNHVGWNLAGEPRASDERMLELLEPFAGQRGRVVRLLLADGQRPPSYAAHRRIVPVETL